LINQLTIHQCCPLEEVAVYNTNLLYLYSIG
jgi:hypothetical protein